MRWGEVWPAGGGFRVLNFVLAYTCFRFRMIILGLRKRRKIYRVLYGRYHRDLNLFVSSSHRNTKYISSSTRTLGRRCVEFNYTCVCQIPACFGIILRHPQILPENIHTRYNLYYNQQLKLTHPTKNLIPRKKKTHPHAPTTQRSLARTHVHHPRTMPTRPVEKAHLSLASPLAHTCALALGTIVPADAHLSIRIYVYTTRRRSKTGSHHRARGRSFPPLNVCVYVRVWVHVRERTRESTRGEVSVSCQRAGSRDARAHIAPRVGDVRKLRDRVGEVCRWEILGSGGWKVVRLSGLEGELIL